MSSNVGAMPINIGIEEGDRREIADGLSRLLADTYTLYLKTHNFHWNVTGPMFQTLHLMFETQYNELAEAVDLLAERIRALGAPAPGGLGSFKRLTSIQDAADQVQNSRVMVQDLIDSRQTMLRDDQELLAAAEDSGDQVTIDMITERIGKNEKDMWMLRSVAAQ